MGIVEVVRAGKKPFKRAYVAVFLWFTGRAIQAAAKVDEQVRKEFTNLPDNFTFSLGVLPDGPWMVIGREKGQVKYLGGNPGPRHLHVRLAMKNIETAFLIFSFQESTAMASARNRLITEGEVPQALAMIRVIDIVEVYLLPKMIARLAVKRYPSWTLGRKVFGRIGIYTRALLGI
jgi:hypothetical protein